MQPNQTSVITNQSTATFETVQMGFDQSAIVHLMDVLTNLYSDSALAVIREYSTNARDSHMAAGNDDPINVYLPGPFNSSFRVADSGVGLSTDDVYNIYSKYGRSTKRGNNVETGMLGLGCKSGLAYTKKFTLKAVKDGIKTIAVISRGDSGAGTITILDTLSTDEPNGVTVEVPVSDHSAFNERARDFFRYWRPGTVLVDGVEPTAHDGLKISDDILIVQGRYGSRNDIVVMGGVPYPVRQNLPSTNLPYNHQIIAWVEMGAVDFVPSREDLLYTDRTKETLSSIRAQMYDGIKQKSREEVANATTAPEAARAYLRWERLNHKLDTHWKGKTIPAALSVLANAHGAPEDANKLFTYDPTRHRNQISDPGRIPLDDVLTLTQVVNFTNKAISPTVKAKLAKYCEDNDIAMGRFIFNETAFGAPWSDEVLKIDYADIASIKLPKKGAPSALQGFLTYVDGVAQNSSDIPAGREVVLTTSAYEISYSQVSRAFPDSTIVVANRNRWEKIKRENPLAITLEEKIQSEIDDLVANWSFSDLIDNARVVGAYFARSLSPLAKETIDDPQLRHLLDLVAKSPNKASARRFSEAASIARQMRTERFGNGFTFTLNHSFDMDYLGRVSEQYPLLEHLNSTNTAAMAEYVNLMYGKDNK